MIAKKPSSKSSFSCWIIPKKVIVAYQKEKLIYKDVLVYAAFENRVDEEIPMWDLAVAITNDVRLDFNDVCLSIEDLCDQGFIDDLYFNNLVDSFGNEPLLNPDFRQLIVARNIREMEEKERLHPSPVPPPRKSLSPGERTVVFERDKYRCVRCGTWKDLAVDHVVPRIKGGTNDLDNLQTLCKSCNSKKGTKTKLYRKGS